MNIVYVWHLGLTEHLDLDLDDFNVNLARKGIYIYMHTNSSLVFTISLFLLLTFI